MQKHITHIKEDIFLLQPHFPKCDQALGGRVDKQSGDNTDGNKDTLICHHILPMWTTVKMSTT